MPRRREVPKRQILPDPKFGSQTLAKFINAIMLAGKKSVAETIVYDALELLAERGHSLAVAGGLQGHQDADLAEARGHLVVAVAGNRALADRQARHPADRHVLADGGDELGQLLGDAVAGARIGGRLQRFDLVRAALAAAFGL